MTDKFKITYGVDDGYAGGDRPQHTSVEANEVEGDESEAELKEMFWRIIEEDFREKVHAYSKQEAEFVAWAQERIAAMKAEEQD